MIREFVVAAMAALAPDRDHAALGDAIVQVVEEERPLFAGDADKLRTASLLVAVAFRESSFRMDAVSKTNDHCAFQVHLRPDLALDPVACTRTAVTMLRESLRACPSHPVAFYASGPGACMNARAMRISNDRVALAKRLLSAHRPTDTRTAGAP